MLWSRPYCRATVLPRDDARSTHKTRVYVIIPMAWFQSGFRRDEAIKPACAPIAWSILIALLPHPSSYRHTPLHLNFAIRMFQILSRKLAILLMRLYMYLQRACDLPSRPESVATIIQEITSQNADCSSGTLILLYCMRIAHFREYLLYFRLGRFSTDFVR